MKVVDITDDLNITPVLPDMPVSPPSPIRAATPMAPNVMPVPAAPTTKTPHIKPNLKPLRTYESDVAEVLANKKISTTSIAWRKSAGRPAKTGSAPRKHRLMPADL